MNALGVLWGMVWARMAIGAAKSVNGRAPPRLSDAAAHWPPPPYSILGVCMAKRFGSAAYAILNELTYYYHYNLRN
eukprot:5060626-Pleurochrysis_carterae.AAC.1